ncbi:MAG: hypothetical protein SPK50_02125 [Mobiluncus porci]|uniref:hypothetical protein n=1 Tax=Mobiluncus porci TaxID=2652278 RepID=UPI0023F0D926|nr:hypothetical protein [Mobiluncus porci]MDD7542564.1 hypothetical protein [Mobiluncus porci]MDY5747916.1 hypothetical protein [Mobiluncus porci]
MDKYVILKEAWRNSVSIYSRIRWLLLFAIFLGAVSGLTPNILTTAFNDSLEVAKVEGKGIVSLTTKGNLRTISVASCRQLIRNVGVKRSGALEKRGRADLLPLAGKIEIWQATPELVPQLFFSPYQIGHDVAISPNNQPFVVWPGVSAPVIPEVLPAQPQGFPNSISAVQIWDGSAFTRSCLVEVDAMLNLQDFLPVLAAGLKTTSSELEANLIYDPTQSLQLAYLSNPLRFLGVALGLLGGACGVIVNRNRNNEFAAYRFGGVSSTEVRLITVTEQAIMSAFFLVSATVSAVVSLSYLDFNFFGILWSVCGACAWMALSPLGAPKLSHPGALLKAR